MDQEGRKRHRQPIRSTRRAGRGQGRRRIARAGPTELQIDTGRRAAAPRRAPPAGSPDNMGRGQPPCHEKGKPSLLRGPPPQQSITSRPDRDHAAQRGRHSPHQPSAPRRIAASRIASTARGQRQQIERPAAAAEHHQQARPRPRTSSKGPRQLEASTGQPVRPEARTGRATSSAAEHRRRPQDQAPCPVTRRQRRQRGRESRTEAARQPVTANGPQRRAGAPPAALRPLFHTDLAGTPCARQRAAQSAAGHGKRSRADRRQIDTGRTGPKMRGFSA